MVTGNDTSQISKTHQLQVLQELMGTILSRTTLARQMGVQYGGDRDIYAALGYPTTISFEEYWNRYKRQDVAKAIINRPASASWRGKVTVYNPNDENDGLKNAWEALEKELGLKQKFLRLDKLSSVGKYGVLFMGFNDVLDNSGFNTPVNPGSALKLLYVAPFSESTAKIKTFVTNVTDPRYGLPEIYELATSDQNTISVHYTRILHVPGELLENDYEGVPILEAVYNRLADLEKVTGGSAEMFWRGAYPGVAAKVDPEYSAGVNLKDSLEDQMKEFEHNLRRILLVEGVDMKNLAPAVESPKDQVDVLLTLISVCTGIPKRILMGSERGELSSDQDADSWAELIQTRREELLEIQIIRPFVDTLMMYKLLSEEPYEIEWISLHTVSEKDQVEVGKARATALKEYTTNPAAAEVVPPESFYKHFLGFTDAQIDEIGAIQLEMAAGDGMGQQMDDEDYEEESPEELEEEPTEETE